MFQQHSDDHAIVHVLRDIATSLATIAHKISSSNAPDLTKPIAAAAAVATQLNAADAAAQAALAPTPPIPPAS